MPALTSACCLIERKAAASSRMFPMSCRAAARFAAMSSASPSAAVCLILSRFDFACAFFTGACAGSASSRTPSLSDVPASSFSSGASERMARRSLTASRIAPGFGLSIPKVLSSSLRALPCACCLVSRSRCASLARLVSVLRVCSTSESRSNCWTSVDRLFGSARM